MPEKLAQLRRRKLISFDEAENLSKDENFKKMSDNIQGEVKYVLSKK